MGSRDTRRRCVICDVVFEATRSDAQTCSPRCRQAKKRGTYVVTAEDRAAMEVAARLVPVPVPPYTPDQYAAALAAAVAAARME